MNRRPRLLASIGLALVGATITTSGWSAQGHRLVALVATGELTPPARQQISRLVDGATLSDVAMWADEYDVGVNQTAAWHYVNIPANARAYDRDRDCPRQPGVAAGTRADRWRDCVVDRILYNEARLADTTLDRADRAVALKFLVHLVGDVHQPFHAIGLARGGNGIEVSVFGSPTCGVGAAASRCNLHGLWDGALIARRNLSDAQYLRLVAPLIARHRANARVVRAPADWALESLGLANGALLRPGDNADERYYRAHIDTVDERLVVGGLRLAALLNRALASPQEATTDASLSNPVS